MINNTIAAISTGMTSSGIGKIRLSGSEAIEIVDKVFRNPSGKQILSKVKTHTIHYGFIYDEDRPIDEVLVLVMKAPRSYTTEDIVEIDCHGGIVVMKKILETVIKYGARPAEPGEFTKRAFLNGRIDLTQAEAVIDVIRSKNEYALDSSIRQLKGNILNKIKSIRKRILSDVAFIEASLDDPEHISTDGFKDKLMSNINESVEELSVLLSTSENGRMIKEGIKTVILGKPNAGKSSLLNVLVGDERAIVTEIAGTTRDTLEENININGISLNIVDTAGIRETEDIVEKIGVNKARDIAKDADLVVYVVDGSTSLDSNDEKILEIIKGKRSIVLLNKVDLELKTTKESIALRTESPIVEISAKNETGIEDFENVLKDMFFNGNLTFNDEIYITNIRHKTAIKEALESLKMVKQSIDDNMPEDFYSIDLMNAYEILGSIIGEFVSDDLVDTIFSDFCMGK